MIPKLILARPVGASKDWMGAESGPWSLYNNYGTSEKFIHYSCYEKIFLQHKQMKKVLEQIAHGNPTIESADDYAAWASQLSISMLESIE